MLWSLLFPPGLRHHRKVNAEQEGRKWAVGHGDGPRDQITGFHTGSQLLHKLHLQAFGYVLQFLFSSSFENYRTTCPCMGFISPEGPCTPPAPKSGQWVVSPSAWSSDWPVTDFSYLFRLWGTLGMCPWLCLKRPPAFPPCAQHFLPEQQWLGASGGTRCTVRLPNAGRTC